MNIRKALTTTFATLMLASTLAALPAVADNPFPVPGHPRVNQVDRRTENQGDRIQQGIRNGSLSPAELQKMRTERSNFRQEVHTMRGADMGHLTMADQRALDQQLNRSSRQIYRFKHN